MSENTTAQFPIKPLGHKSYGTIAHLPGSRQGRDDIGINPGHARIACEKCRDKHDRVIVQEKLDGSNVSVANIDGVIVPLIRAGYPAISSRWEQHRLFAGWVFERTERFGWLRPGERLCGEWLAQAHGTVYDLSCREPFVAFDIMRAGDGKDGRSGHDRALYDELRERAIPFDIALPQTLHDGPPCTVARALEMLGDFGFYGATEKPEGAVWRIERKGKVDFLAKYVRPNKIDGCYLAEVSGKDSIWNWRPEKSCADSSVIDSQGGTT